jgi:hypothetical protein
MLCPKLATSIIVAPFARASCSAGRMLLTTTQPRLPSSTAMYQAQQSCTSRPVGLCLKRNQPALNPEVPAVADTVTPAATTHIEMRYRP